jgi:hypothetical protein
MRYATNKNGEFYPFELFERKVKKLNILKPLNLNGIMSICEFEKRIYEAKSLSKETVLDMARTVSRKYNDFSEDSIGILNTPHIYSWESACSYHGYGLAKLALTQWREYFYKKYGYIVDNPQVGKELQKVWKLGSSKTFKEFVVLATGKNLSADAHLNEVTRSISATLSIAKKKISRLEKVKLFKKTIDLDALIEMTSGKKVVADNRKSFEDMAEKYQKWLIKQK